MVLLFTIVQHITIFLRKTIWKRFILYNSFLVMELFYLHFSQILAIKYPLIVKTTHNTCSTNQTARYTDCYIQKCQLKIVLIRWCPGSWKCQNHMVSIYRIRTRKEICSCFDKVSTCEALSRQLRSKISFKAS